MRQALARRPDLTPSLGPQERDETFEPGRHLSSARVLVNRAVAAGEVPHGEQREAGRATPGSTVRTGYGR